MIGKICLVLSVLCALTMGAWAEEEAVADASPFSGSVTVDVVTQYFFRGILQESDGFIAQPSAKLNWDVYDNEDGVLINNASLVFGTWHSIHSEDTGSTNSNLDPWFESEYYFGANFTPAMLSNTTASLTFSSHTSPNDAFGTYDEIALGVAYDDSDLWGDGIFGFTGLNPNVQLVTEVDGAADGGDEGTYLQLGVAPSLIVTKIGARELTAAVPVTVGISLDDYYEGAGSSDDGIGFVDVGLDLGLPLTENLQLTAGPHLLWLTSDTEDLNGGDNFEVIGKVGVTLSF